MTSEGWYPDPLDPSGTRYWDGTRWTDQRRPAASARTRTRVGWYHHWAVLTVTSILCLPLGLALLWTSPRQVRTKVVGTVAVLALLLAGELYRQHTIHSVTEDLARAFVAESQSKTPTTPPPTATPTSIAAPDPDVLCRAAFQDEDVYAAFNACTGEQYDRLLPDAPPGHLPRIPECLRSYRGIACDGIPVPGTG